MRPTFFPARPWQAFALFASLLAGPTVAGAAPNAADVSFLTKTTVLWLGHTQVIPVHLKAAAETDTTFTAAVADPRTVAVLRAPMFLAGEQTAYLRVQALQAGRTRVQIFGGPTLDLQVKADPAEAANAKLDPESRRPHIISPMPGATVWGQFAVGVTMFDSVPAAQPDGWFTAGAPAIPEAPPLKVQLRLPNGTLLDAISATPPDNGPEREFQFSVPAAGLPAGNLPLVAVASRAGYGGAGSGHWESAPLSVQVGAPPADSVWTGECESPEVMGITKELYAPARPVYFGIQQPGVFPDPLASGGKNIHNPGRGWTLPFIVKAPGEYQLMVRARGEFGGGAYPSLALFLNSNEAPDGLVRLVGSKYDRVPVGAPVPLDAGPQLLTVVFNNGFNQAKENRNLYLDSYELARVGDVPPPVAAATPAHAPALPKPALVTGGLHNPAPVAALPPLLPGSAPQLNIVYPANSAQVCAADAVVVKIAGGTVPVESADLMLDGQLQHTKLRGPGTTEPLVFPLVLRGITPGDHRLTVRATVATGQTVDSPDRLLTVLAQPPAARGPYQRAVWLLDRLAFGPEPKELAAILTQGESNWLASRLLAPYLSDPAEQTALENACTRYSHMDDDYQTVMRALDEWTNTSNPVRARFTAWAENHFSTWINKTKSIPKWKEHLAFSTLGVAPFADLLEASAHSPAMLTYLDQEKSYANKINENYAREIMELHTLGVHGGYQQTDVTELAKVLNGWTLADEATLPEAGATMHLVAKNGGNEAGVIRDWRFVPALNDGKARQVLGLEFDAATPAGRYDRIQLALEMLAAHPSTAQHVCRKLAEHYVSVPAPDALVNHLARTFLESGGDMRVVLFTMVSDPEFWSAPQKVASPFDYSMRAARLCRAASLQAGLPEEQTIKPELLEGFLKHSGMGLFDRVTPDGYPENSGAYADSNALLQRWRFMQTQTAPLGRLVPAAWQTPPPTPLENDLNHVETAAVDPAQRFVDLAAVRLTGRLLSSGSNQAALDVLGRGRPEDMQQALIFVSLLPETSLR